MTTTEKRLAGIARISMRWGDQDVYGHVNNCTYFRFMEQARIEMVEPLGLDLRPVGQGPVIINAACTFLAQMNYPGTVEVSTFVGRPGRSSFMTFSEIRLHGDPTLYAEGSAKVVWIDFATGKSVPVPDPIRAWLERPAAEG
jgi:acyl-CoA thioester hydrolase